MKKLFKKYLFYIIGISLNFFNILSANAALNPVALYWVEPIESKTINFIEIIMKVISWWLFLIIIPIIFFIWVYFYFFKKGKDDKKKWKKYFYISISLILITFAISVLASFLIRNFW